MEGTHSSCSKPHMFHNERGNGEKDDLQGTTRPIFWKTCIGIILVEQRKRIYEKSVI